LNLSKSSQNRNESKKKRMPNV